MILLLAALAMAPQGDRVDAMWDFFSARRSTGAWTSFITRVFFEECISIPANDARYEPADAQISANLAWMVWKSGTQDAGRGSPSTSALR